MVGGQNRLCCHATASSLFADWSSGSSSIPPIPFSWWVLLSKPRSVFAVCGIQHHAEIAQLAPSRLAQSPGLCNVLVLCHFPASQGCLRMSMQSRAGCPAFLGCLRSTALCCAPPLPRSAKRAPGVCCAYTVPLSHCCLTFAVSLYME